MNGNAREETGLREGLCSGRRSVKGHRKCEDSNRKQIDGDSCDMKMVSSTLRLQPFLNTVGLNQRVGSTFSSISLRGEVEQS